MASYDASSFFECENKSNPSSRRTTNTALGMSLGLLASSRRYASPGKQFFGFGTSLNVMAVVVRGGSGSGRRRLSWYYASHLHGFYRQLPGFLLLSQDKREGPKVADVNTKQVVMQLSDVEAIELVFVTCTHNR